MEKKLNLLAREMYNVGEIAVLRDGRGEPLRLDWVQDFEPICSYDVYPMKGEFIDVD